MLSSPRTPTPRAIASVASRIRSISVAAERDRRQRARRVAGVDAGLLDVLHHAAEVELLAVEERVDVDLDRVVEEPVDQHRVLRADLGRRARCSRAARRRRRRSPCRARRARTTAAPAPGSRSRPRSPAPRRTRSPCRAWARSARPRRAPGRTRRAPRRGGSPPARCRRSARRRPRAPGPGRAGSGRRAGTITPATGPACCSACTISSTSSRVSGSKYSRSEVS